jgi:hypothetical protein
MDSITRRTFLEKAGITAASLGAVAEGKEWKGAASEKKAAKGSAPTGPVHYAIARCVTEWAYSTGKVYADPLGKVEPDATGTWQAPLTPTFKDWVLVLEKIT